jgi:hypothetical protein
MGAMVVTDQFRKELEASPLKGLTFHPVTKHRVVEFHWEDWDRNEHYGKLPPEVDEPEDLVHELSHSEEASRALGQLWEARAKPLVVVQVMHERGPGDYDYRVVTSPRAVRGMDFFFHQESGPDAGLRQDQGVVGGTCAGVGELSAVLLINGVVIEDTVSACSQGENRLAVAEHRDRGAGGPAALPARSLDGGSPYAATVLGS